MNRPSTPFGRNLRLTSYRRQSRYTATNHLYLLSSHRQSPNLCLDSQSLFMPLPPNPLTPNTSVQRWPSRSCLPSALPSSTSTPIHHITRIPSSPLRKSTRARSFEVCHPPTSFGTHRRVSQTVSDTALALKWVFRLERLMRGDRSGWKDYVSTNGFCGVNAGREALSENSALARARSSTRINNSAKNRRSNGNGQCGRFQATTGSTRLYGQNHTINRGYPNGDHSKLLLTIRRVGHLSHVSDHFMPNH